MTKGKCIAYFADFDAAAAAVKSVAAKLSAMDFAHRKPEQLDECDVYGVAYEGRNYYFKVTVAAGQSVAVISLHPLQHALKTKRGELKP